MKLEINVISTEMVTPSSPTPPLLNKYKLSYFDQIMPRLLMPSVYFYAPNNDTLNMNKSERLNLLKKSLSKVLAVFYPVAGRLVGNSYVNCNDKGATFIEAQANCKLVDVITNPNPEELDKCIPCCDPEVDRDLCLVVQATFFSCGGLAIGIGLSHKLADAMSNFMFVNSWAAFSRGESLVQTPTFESAILFPPEDLNGEIVEFEKKGRIVSKIFTFSPQKIAELRDKYTNNTKDVDGLLRPTRLEALSNFIGSRIVVATEAKDDRKKRKVYALRIAVNIRTRVVPPLSEYLFGNMVLMPEITLPPLEKDDEDGVYGLVKKTRAAIKNENLVDLFAFKNIIDEASKSEAVMLWCSSLCCFSLSKADFGWGKPVWFALGSNAVKNTVFFANSLSEGGIDAFVNLKEEEMAEFEVDEELLQYVSSGN